MINIYETKSGKTRGYAQTLLDEIESCYLQFKDFHNQLVSIVRDNNLNTSDIPYFKEDTYYQFQDKFFILKAKLLDLINETTSLSTDFHSTLISNTQSRNETVITQARLPKIELPSFSGDYLSWISYRDMFISLVHNNQCLSGVQKYYF